MPKILKLNIDDWESDCEKVKSLADEYLHDELILHGEPGISGKLELPEEDKDFIDRHIAGCRDCLDFIEAESRYLEEIKSAEYVPEISISQSVMDRIIENRLIVDKPPKRRIFPVGLVSAAAVVLIMFALTKTGALNLFMKYDNTGSLKNAGPESANEMPADGDSWLAALPDDEARNKARRAMDGLVDYGEDAADRAEENEEIIAAAPAAFAAEDIAPDEMPFATAPDFPLPMSPPAPRTNAETQNMSYENFMAMNKNLDFYKIYRLKNNDVAGKEEDIFKDIEFSAMDPDGRFDIIEKRYDEILNRNLLENNISAEEWLSEKSEGAETDNEYIGIIYDID